MAAFEDTSLPSRHDHPVLPFVLPTALIPNPVYMRFDYFFAHFLVARSMVMTADIPDQP